MELLYMLIIRTSRWLKTIFRHLNDWEPNHLKHQTPKSVLVLNYTETKVCLLPIEEGVTLSSPRYARCGESCLKFSPSLSEYSNTLIKSMLDNKLKIAVSPLCSLIFKMQKQQQQQQQNQDPKRWCIFS